MIRIPATGPRLAAALSLALVACAHTGGPARHSRATAFARVASEDEYGRLRADYEGMPAGTQGRAELRERLEAWLLDEARREHASDRNDEAWDAIRRALTLWDADELKSAPRDDALADAAATFERFYRRRGAHREVIALLGVQIALRSDQASLPARFAAVSAWVRGDRERCSDAGCERLIDEVEGAVATWPAPFLVEQLASLYWQRQRSAGLADVGRSSGRSERASALAELFRQRSVDRTGFDLARLYLRVSEPGKALAALSRLTGQAGDDPALREALERSLAPAAQPAEIVALAALLSREQSNRPVGVRICRDGARRFPASAELQLCIGKLAGHEQIALAMSAYERALKLQPERRDTWETLAELQPIRLAQLVGDERTEQLEAELRRVEAFHEEARRRFPGDPLKASLAGALYEVGHGYYLAGRIEPAVRYLKRSLATAPTVYAQEQLAQIELKRDHAPEAVALFRAALDRRQPQRQGSDEQSYWDAKLYHGLADAVDEMGDARGALDARRRSLDAWDRLLMEHHDSDEVAEAEMERGKLLYQLGERERGLAALQRAVDAAPERSSTYADALAFLVPRGELSEALDAYHRALGRSRVSEYIKVYASLWILDLDKRLHAPEDLLARDFLDAVRGPRWHHELARWASGHASDEELRSRADTPGKRCELDFYLAMRSLRKGQIDEARAQWRKVVGSGMMAFFEYEMAGYYLRHESEVATAPASPRPDGLPSR